MRLAELLLGKRIADRDADTERLGVASGVPVLGLDALASAAYGPEAALTVLLALGAAGIRFAGPVTLVIVALLAVVQTSYRQTIGAYPDGGGSYTVSKENLGKGLGLVAAAALFVDYALNVAVAISAGVGALVSAVPRLLPLTLPLCLALLALLTLANLRGLRTTGVLFMIPTAAFVACLGGVILLGLVRAALAGGHPAPVVPPTPLHAATAAVSAWIVVRAFAAGCTAMTGVEAVSNAVPVFRAPAQARAKRTLATVVGILVVLLLGIAALTHAYGIGATEPGAPGYQSVLSQLVAAVGGRGPLYAVAMAAVIAVLCLSANTSFADFPRLCRALALDRHLPEAFAHAGRRLVYSTGVVLLAALAGVLLLAFRGITDRLVPLFAVGAFTAFTLSQAGMVVHWRRHPGPSSRRSLALNAAGAALTGATLLVILASKFAEGAWITVLCIPALVVLFRRMRARYDAVLSAIRTDAPLDLEDAVPPVVVVPVRHLDQVTRKALRFALTISPDVHAIQVLAAEREVENLANVWDRQVAEPARRRGLHPPQLVRLRTQYREVVDPLLAYVRRLAAQDRSRFVAVLVPELVETRWYHALFFSHTATALKRMLLSRGGPQVVVIDAPWHLAGHRRVSPRRRAQAEARVPLAVRTAER
ncbi:APC family permease [Anaeromyxobacter terrae]|uniref:APC family permease n=1 Tax=Anaeromyxobacter terrae TaxID=2925406 RepID=UPI001F5A2294|nr:APC family permease [Anaeromyxobacter sp. SG22]